MKKIFLIIGCLITMPVFAFDGEKTDCKILKTIPEKEEIIVKCETKNAIIHLKAILLTYEEKEVK